MGYRKLVQFRINTLYWKIFYAFGFKSQTLPFISIQFSVVVLFLLHESDIFFK